MAKLNGLMGLVASGLALAMLPGVAQGQGQGVAPAPDQELVTRLHQLGQDEIAMAQLGQQRAVRDSVRSYAQMMERDHQAINNGLMAYAQSRNMDRLQVGERGGALEHGVLARAPLVNCAQSEFDYNYAAKTVADHQGALDAAAAARGLARDPALIAIINDNMTMLTAHLLAAQALQASIPAPPAPRLVPMPAFPAAVSRTQTGADVPPPAALLPGALAR
jgi:putative membrane protein